MKKRAVKQLKYLHGGKTAAYIVAHAKIQKRHPSESYKQERNPKKALELALKELSCHDCDAKPDELHSDGCDVERCPCCKRQLISCGCSDVLHPGWVHSKDKGGDYWWPPNSQRILWHGVMCEEEEKIARRDGKYIRWKEGSEFGTDTKNFCFNVDYGVGWVPCNNNHPDATPDLNYGAAKIVKKCPFQ